MTRKSDFAFWSFMTMAGLAGVTTVFNVSRTYSATTPNAEIYRQLDLFGDVLERVRSDYVEKPDDASLVENAINGMLAALDPHSAYLSAKHFRDMQIQTRGEFGGLGIEVTTENGVVKVVFADRRYTRCESRRPGQRPHYPPRQRADRRADSRAGGREDARTGQHADHADDRAQGA